MTIRQYIQSKIPDIPYKDIPKDLKKFWKEQYKKK
jgi:hypothetical protein